jgi:hypothetical protein
MIGVGKTNGAEAGALSAQALGVHESKVTYV